MLSQNFSVIQYKSLKDNTVLGKGQWCKLCARESTRMFRDVDARTMITENSGAIARKVLYLWCRYFQTLCFPFMYNQPLSDKIDPIYGSPFSTRKSLRKPTTLVSSRWYPTSILPTFHRLTLPKNRP